MFYQEFKNMDLKNVKALYKKYWDGKTSIEEEETLKNIYVDSENIDESERIYLQFLEKERSSDVLGSEFDDSIIEIVESKNDTRKSKTYRFWYAAASIVFFATIGIIFKNNFVEPTVPAAVVQQDTFDDPEKAFEETKKALLLLSSKLNSGSEYTTKFSKFEQNQKRIKQN